MKIVNLTPHKLVLMNEDLSVTAEIEASGQVARVATRAVKVDETPEGVPLYRTEYGAVEGLPAPQDGVIYVVSGLVRAAVGDSRPDVYSPGKLVRDDAGQPIGAVGLTR